MASAATAMSTTIPAGGGAGMVLRCDVLAAAIDAAVPADDTRPRLLMSPRGRRLDQAYVRELVASEGAVIVCGRFEGVDERVIEGRGLTEVSIGDYILSGGEMAAMVVLDACVRLIPGVMGKEASGRTKASRTGCWNIRTIPGRANGRGGACPRRCSRATMPASRAGGANRPRRSPANAGPICGRRARGDGGLPRAQGR